MCKRREYNSYNYVGVVLHGIVIFRNWNWRSNTFQKNIYNNDLALHVVFSIHFVSAQQMTVKR